MQKWEYCRLFLGGSIYALERLTVRGSSGRELKRDKTKGDESDLGAVNREIAELGASGWELAGVVTTDRPEFHILYFKRPLGD